MLRYVNCDIVFQEIPDEVTLAVNISNCPNRCKGCHSPYLWDDVGEILDENILSRWLEKYGDAITCICFMGGDAEPKRVADLSGFLRTATNGGIKTAWYSGRDTLPEISLNQSFDYIKLGAYDENLGGLDSATTNQRFYRIQNSVMTDITNSFHKQIF